MTVKEAHKIITTKLPDMDVVSCYEYETLFVFNVVPSGYATKKANKILDCSWSVNKETGLIRDFKPFHISVKEYRAGKQIMDFK